MSSEVDVLVFTLIFISSKHLNNTKESPQFEILYPCNESEKDITRFASVRMADAISVFFGVHRRKADRLHAVTCDNTLSVYNYYTISTHVCCITKYETALRIFKI